MRFFIIFLATLSFQSFAQNEEKDIHQFVNGVIFPTDTISRNIKESGLNSFISDDTSSILSDSSIFSRQDFKYLREQILRMQDFKWKPGMINGGNILTKKEISKSFKKKNGWDHFRSKHGQCINFVSMPLFNVDRSICVIHVGTQCDYRTGGGSTRVYQKKKNGWTFIKTYSIWVS